MKSLIVAILVVVSKVAVADSGSADAGSGSAAGSATPAPEPSLPTHASVDPKACVAEMEKDPEFAGYIIYKAEKMLGEKVNREQVEKDICVLRDHTDAQADISKNQKHVLLAYIAMWLVAAGFVLYLWRKQQALKLEISGLRKDLDAATKDSK